MRVSRREPTTRGTTSYFRGVTESEVRRSRKLNSFPLPVALLADVLKTLLSTLPFSSTVYVRAPRLARMSNAVDAHSRLCLSLSFSFSLRFAWKFPSVLSTYMRVFICKLSQRCGLEGREKRGRMSFLVEGGFSWREMEGFVVGCFWWDRSEVCNTCDRADRFALLFCVGNRFTGVLRVMQRFSKW